MAFPVYLRRKRRRGLFGSLLLRHNNSRYSYTYSGIHHRQNLPCRRSHGPGQNKQKIRMAGLGTGNGGFPHNRLLFCNSSMGGKLLRIFVYRSMGQRSHYFLYKLSGSYRKRHTTGRNTIESCDTVPYCVGAGCGHTLCRHKERY